VNCISLKTLEEWCAARFAFLDDKTHEVGYCSNCPDCTGLLQEQRKLLQMSCFASYTEDTMYFKVNWDALQQGDVRIFVHPVSGFWVFVDAKDLASVELSRKVLTMFGDMVTFDNLLRILW